jgi:hypothetical protein
LRARSLGGNQNRQCLDRELATAALVAIDGAPVQDGSAQHLNFIRSRIAVKFVQPAAHRGQFCPVLLFALIGTPPPTTTVVQPHSKEGVMQYLPSKFALTVPLAALLWAIPVSIDLTRPHTTADRAELIGIGLKIDSAEARVGRPATPRSAAGVARRTTRQTVRAVTPYAGVAVAAPVAAATAAVVTPRCGIVMVRGVAVRRCGRVY